jgi:hypothetical protein
LNKQRLAGRIISVLAVLFLLFDIVGHLTTPAPVAEAFVRLGYPVTLSFGIGVLGLVCTILYAIPRTSILGAILLTGYLGGATAANVRVSDPLFETLFPIIFGVVVWAGIFLRDDLLRRVVPLRRQCALAAQEKVTERNASHLDA